MQSSQAEKNKELSTAISQLESQLRSSKEENADLQKSSKTERESRTRCTWYVAGEDIWITIDVSNHGSRCLLLGEWSSIASIQSVTNTLREDKSPKENLDAEEGPSHRVSRTT